MIKLVWVERPWWRRHWNFVKISLKTIRTDWKKLKELWNKSESNSKYFGRPNRIQTRAQSSSAPTGSPMPPVGKPSLPHSNARASRQLVQSVCKALRRQMTVLDYWVVAPQGFEPWTKRLWAAGSDHWATGPLLFYMNVRLFGRLIPIPNKMANFI